MWEGGACNRMRFFWCLCSLLENSHCHTSAFLPAAGSEPRGGSVHGVNVHGGRSASHPQRHDAGVACEPWGGGDVCRKGGGEDARGDAWGGR